MSYQRIWKLWFSIIALSICATGCDEELKAFDPWLVTIPQDASPIVQDMAGTLGAYLERLTGRDGSIETRDGFPDLRADTAELTVHLAGGPLGSDDDSFKIRIESGGDAWTTLTLFADTTLGHQYGVYEVLRQLGVRFYHPEEEFVPEISPRQLQLRARTRTVIARGDTYQPDFALRSFTFHNLHPLEHLESFSDAQHPIDEARRVNEWMVKNRAGQFRGLGRGIADEDARNLRGQELASLKTQLGMYGASGITLHAQQQGGGAELSLDDPDPKTTIENIVTSRLADSPNIAYFGIHFGPTELTVTPDRQTVNWLNWAGAAVKSIRPNLPVFINNHTTGTQPSPNFDDLGCPNGTNEASRADYYDLSFHTNPELGVQVHTVMFYPLEGAAPVYEQVSFEHKRCLMQKASEAGRPLLYFPEGSWWLSFDNPVPLYLPIYIHSRGRDIDLLKPLLASRGEGSLVGHKMFNSGHEWGYWQQDYAVGLWHFNTDVSFQEVLYEMTDPLCDPESFPERCTAQNEAIAVLNEIIDHQIDYFLERTDYRGMAGGLYFYFAGEDPADEIAASIGLGFRPIRPSFAEVVSWSDEGKRMFQDTDLQALRDADALHADWVARLDALQTLVPPAGMPWLDEITDGIAINGLRARHTWQLYESAIAGVFSPDLDETMSRVETVIARRESQYRYPLAQINGGGVTPDTAVPNGTTYPYRVHTKTHLMTYWTYRTEQLQALLEAEPAGEQIILSPVFGDVDEPVQISYPSGALSAEITVGGVTTHYPSPSLPVPNGVLPASVIATVGMESSSRLGAIVRGGEQRQSAERGLTIIEPSSAVVSAVLGPLLPQFSFALSPSLVRLAIAPSLKPLNFEKVANTRLSLSGDTLVSEPFDLTFQLQSNGIDAGVDVTLLNLIATTSAPDSLGDTVNLAGRLRLADIVNGLVVLAGFDEAGAWATLADFLDFDPADPPESIAVIFDVLLTTGR